MCRATWLWAARLQVSPGEQWLFWSAASAAYLKSVKARYPRVYVSLLHSDMISWILEVRTCTTVALADGVPGVTVSA